MANNNNSDDFTQDCLSTAEVNNKKITEPQLRQRFCQQCKNYKCGHAKWGKPQWEERMATQEDRLLNNPNFGDPNSSKWEFLREADFPDLARKALMMEIADRKGDWSIPDVSDFFVSPSQFSEGSDVQEEQDTMPSPKAPERKPIKIKSNTKNVFYTVVLEDDKPISCDCAAGSRNKPCSHLKEAVKINELEKEKQEIKDGDEEKPVDPIVVMTPEDKMKLGGIHLIKNSSCDPHGIMVGETKVPNQAPTANMATAKPKEDPWETRKVKQKQILKPGSTIKL